MFIPTRTARLQAALFLFLKPPTNHRKINFSFSNIFCLLISLLLFSSLSRCRALRDAKNLPSPLFQSSPQQSIPTQNFQNLPHTFSKMPFIPACPSQHLHHLIFLPLQLWNSPPSASELQLIQLLLQSRGGQLLLINPPLLTHQESTWIQGGFQSTHKIVQIGPKTIL